MECHICLQELADDANKCWLVENAGGPLNSDVIINPNPVHKSCAVASLDKRGGLGGTVIGFKQGATKPGVGGLILRK